MLLQLLPLRLYVPPTHTGGSIDSAVGVGVRVEVLVAPVGVRVGVREGVNDCDGVGVRDAVGVLEPPAKAVPVSEGVSVGAVGTAVSLAGNTPHSS